MMLLLRAPQLLLLEGLCIVGLQLLEGLRIVGLQAD
jgi:hypothetical protein